MCIPTEPHQHIFLPTFVISHFPLKKLLPSFLIFFSLLSFFFEEAKMKYINQNGSTSTRCAKKNHPK